MDDDMTRSLIKLSIYMGWLAISYIYLTDGGTSSVTDPIDETGWVPDGAFAKILVGGEGDE